jgi:hypothetical protein
MLIKKLTLAIAMICATSSAFANCYELIGCTDSDRFQRSDLRELSCQALWEVRNQIYYENGYCFQSDDAIDFFGNDGCYTRRPAFNRIEQANIDNISRVERQMGC